MAAPLRLIVLARDQRDRVQETWAALSHRLADAPDIEVLAAEVTEDLRIDHLDADLVVVIGGDGAILRACRKLGEHQLPILGVNLGRLGFLADLSPEEFERQLSCIVRREYQVVEHLMFECLHHRADGRVERSLGLNEVLISSAGSLRMISVEMSVNGQPATTYACDGLIFATPVGSTAHSLSAGGPILRQDLQAFVITPICPHTLTNRPLVDQADCCYRLSVPQAPDGAKMVIDGQVHRDLGSGDVLELRRAPVSFKLAKVPGTNYYATLHRKLGWSGRPRYRDEQG